MKELNKIEMAEVVGGDVPNYERDWLSLWASLVGNPVDRHVDMYGNPLEI